AAKRAPDALFIHDVRLEFKPGRHSLSSLSAYKNTLSRDRDRANKVHKDPHAICRLADLTGSN
ncbi:MAG: hypothetical protein SO031_02110, partial [Candidatus Ventricola sp.]|nr:hypothetical protein [Candidatus Ventricola sp.]